MSAIAAVHIAGSGFAIGADGRARWMFQESLSDVRKQMESEQEQKIFATSTVHWNLMYGVTGSAYNDDKSFSVVEECGKAAIALLESPFANYLEYVERLSESVLTKIAAAHAEDRFDYDPSPLSPPGQENLIVRLFFCGYFGGRPIACDVQINNNSGSLSCETFPYSVDQMGPVVLGSERIAKLMYVEHDWRFRNYTVQITPKSTLQDAIECVRGYLRACSTPLAKRLDPFCEIIGGHIHIAVITPEEVRWDTPPGSAYKQIKSD